MSLSIKQPKDYTKKEREVFAYLTLHGTQRVVGSASIKEMDYSADYDLMEYVSFERTAEMYELILTLFREKFRTAYKSKNIWITDFKCGVLAGGKPIRWKKEDIEKGFQIIEDVKIYFVDCLQEKSTIKLDAITLINGLFHEFSEIYFITFGDYKTYEPEYTKKENIETSLLKDVRAYTDKGNYLKSLKRLFAYLRISGKDPALTQSLVDYFNSPVGELASYKSDLELVTIMISQSFKPVALKHIIFNLKYIAKKISPHFRDLVKSILQMKTAEKIKKHTEEVEEILNMQIQEKTKEFIANNKKIYSYIKV
jgi:hypothetical protein